MTRIQVDESTLRKAISTIEELRERLTKYEAGESASLGTAIKKSIENPTQAPRNRLSSEVARAAIFQPRDMKKARKSETDRRAKNRRDLRKAKGLRESPYDRS